MSVKATTSFELSSLQMTSDATGNTVDLRMLVQEINVYEDLFSNVVTGDLTISDSTNQLSSLPIFGYEYLEITFKSNMDVSLLNKTFRVTSVTNVTPVSDRNYVYVIKFSSVQDILNESTSVSRSYTKTRISDMVADVGQNYLGISNWVTLETTKYLHDYVLPFLDPFTCLNFLAGRANSESFKGALYLCYENRDGFHFRSLESAMIQEPVASFHVQPANVRENGQIDDEADRRAIQDYEIVSLPDVLDNTHVGMYGARLMVHSLVQKIYRVHDFDYLKTYPNYAHVEPTKRVLSMVAAANSNTETRLGGVQLNGPESLLRLMPFDEEKVQVTTPLSEDGGKPLEEKPAPSLPKYDETEKKDFPSDAGNTPRDAKTIRDSRIKNEEVKIEPPDPPILNDVDFSNTVESSSSNPDKGYSFISRQKVERWLLPRDSQRQGLFENIRLVITVPGTTDVTVGDIVEVQLPAVEPVTKSNPQKMDQYYSGRYLVSTVRHRIQQSDNAFYTIMEVVKDSVFTAYPI
jgi:hypothetical protein